MCPAGWSVSTGPCHPLPPPHPARPLLIFGAAHLGLVFTRPQRDADRGGALHLSVGGSWRTSYLPMLAASGDTVDRPGQPTKCCFSPTRLCSAESHYALGQQNAAHIACLIQAGFTVLPCRAAAGNIIRNCPCIHHARPGAPSRIRTGWMAFHSMGPDRKTASRQCLPPNSQDP